MGTQARNLAAKDRSGTSDPVSILHSRITAKKNSK
jgi:hypothetical protein